MSRKRPAPGTTPVGYAQQAQPYQNSYMNAPDPHLSDDQFLQWGQNAQVSSDHSDPSMYNISDNSYPPPNGSQPSNQLARRPFNQAIARQTASGNQWMSDQPSTPNTQSGNTNWSDDLDELLEKSQIAKREAQSKRKQIPPFVLKLHSFLENPKNTDLIRWSEDGKSFIVINEDEFANKLIPELFKHNNYASFVRQLNMYGFHKKVGLSDNSMRASERKAKSPSEYQNPFFRRGYPDLLWLIQKPKNQTTTQKGKNRNKSEERDEEDDLGDDASAVESSRPRPQLTLPTNDRALTQEQFQTVQRELMHIRRQQQQITQMLGQLKREHDALVNQANDYQNKHSRHEHSINAILTFLATLYNRSLQNHEGAQDIAKMFANTLAQDKSSNVVDIDNYAFDLPDLGQVDSGNQPYKKQRLMITDGSSDNRAKTVSPGPSAESPLPRQTRRSSLSMRSSATPRTTNVEEVFDPGVKGRNQSNNPRSGNQQQDMMSLIHSTNARNSNPNTPVPDFSNVLNDLENSGGNTPLSTSQRDNMLRMLNDQTNQTGNNALMSPSQSSAQSNFDFQLANTKADLDSLARMQAQQDRSVENLTNLLQPLSPTGSIPGIGDGQEFPPPPLNIDDFLSNNDYFSELPSDGNGNIDFSGANNNPYDTNGGADGFDFNDDDPLFGDVEDGNEYKSGNNNFFNTNDTDGLDDQEGGRVESVASSEATTPKQNSTTLERSPDGPTTRAKGRKMSSAGDPISKRTRNS